MSKKNVEWEWKKLKDICNINFGTRVVRKKDGGSIYPVYGGGGATFMMDSYNREDCLVVSRFAMSQQCTRFVSGKFFLNDSGLSLSPKDNSLTESFLNTTILGLNDDIYALGRGTAQKNLNVDAFKELMLPIPPLDEQERIVKVLDDAFEKIDAIKTTAETNLQNAKDLFQTTLANELSITDEKIKQGWTSKNIGDIAEIKGGKRIPRGEKLLTEVTKHPYIRVTDFNENGSVDLDDIHYISDEIYEGIKRYIITTDDAYVSIAGTIGKCGIVPPELNNANLTENACRLIFNNCLYNRFFVYFSLGNEFKELTQKESRANAMPKLSISRLSQIKISVPPLPIQKQIVAKLDSLSEKVKQLESNYKQVLTDCDELKKALLKQAFEGML